MIKKTDKKWQPSLPRRQLELRNEDDVSWGVQATSIWTAAFR